MIFLLRYQMDDVTDVIIGPYHAILQDLFKLIQDRLPANHPYRHFALPFTEDQQNDIFEVAARRMRIRFDVIPLA
ncbi:hypothetical protein [Falsirhodobacter xinxiangensis]|uniref:hypothetical protein n=1 Tax=Falsirhodobacter xinxiangensis TaxID=2530049 RepID=UPI0010AB1C66|nr:hypothetical protein [Rhodobacter xinxiangensis]